MAAAGIPAGAGAPAPPMSAGERQARHDLAAFYRLVHHFGWTDLIYNHISARIPGTADAYLVNPYGLMFEEITAANLIAVDLASGRALARAGSNAHPNVAVHLLHGRVLKARSDLACIAHVHTPAIMAVSAMTDGLLPISQTAMGLLDRLGYHDYGFDEGAGERLARDFAAADVVILRNHGVLAGGRTIPEAFLNLYNLEFACRAQVQAMAAGSALSLPPADVLAAHMQANAAWLERQGGSRDPAGCVEWDACLRLLEREGIRYAD